MRYFRIDVDNTYFTESIYQAMANDVTDADIEEVAQETMTALGEANADHIDNEFQWQRRDYNGALEDLLMEIENEYYNSLTYQWEEISVEDFRMNAEDWVYGA